MKCGCTCLVEYPFTDGTGAKVRPVLVVSRDDFNKGADVVVVPISSRPNKSDPYSVYIDESDSTFSKTGLRCSSAVKWGKPFTIDKSLLMRRLGAINSHQFAEVISLLLRLFKNGE